MGNHVVEVTEASVDLDYNEILENIENTIAERISDMIGDEAVSYTHLTLPTKA